MGARVGLMTASALLWAAAFPPLAWQFCIFAAAPLLLWSLRGASTRAGFYLGLAHGLIAYGLLAHWLYFIFGRGMAPLTCLLALFTAAFGWGFCLLQTRPSRYFPLWAGALWLAVEFYRVEFFPLKFAWFILGAGPGVTCLLPWIGVYGVSFLLVAASAGLIQKQKIGGAVFAALVAFSCLPPAPYAAPERPIRVIAVQAEFEHMNWFSELSRSTSEKRPDFILWPEYAVPYKVLEKPALFEKLQALAQENRATLVVGTQTAHETDPERWRNTALQIAPDGSVAGRYYKMNTVHFFNDGVPGTEFTVFTSPRGRFSTPVCFDYDFPENMRRFTQHGAEFFLIPSCDPAGWGEAEHLQHSSLIPLRAAETGRWIVCAATSGISQCVDPNGRVHAHIPAMQDGAFACSVEARSDRTPYMIWGWLIPWASLAFAPAFLLAVRFPRTRAFSA